MTLCFIILFVDFYLIVKWQILYLIKIQILIIQSTDIIVNIKSLPIIFFKVGSTSSSDWVTSSSFDGPCVTKYKYSRNNYLCTWILHILQYNKEILCTKLPITSLHHDMDAVYILSWCVAPCKCAGMRRTNADWWCNV